MPVSCWTAAMAAGSLMLPAQRPASTYFSDDPVTGARCHSQRSETQDLCPELFESLQLSWSIQVDQDGWPEPFSDRGVGGTDGLDVYLSTDADWGGYTNSSYTDADPNDGRFASESFIVIDPRISDIHLYMAHEFNHVLQFAVDSTEPSFVPWEAAATLAEERTYPGEGSLGDVAPDFQRTPWESVFGDSSHLWIAFDIWSYYEYGSALWMEHLHQTWGVAPVDFWWAMTNKSWSNETDVLEAYRAVTGSQDQGLLQFSLDRGRMGQGSEPEWMQAVDAPLRFQGTLETWDEAISSKNDIQDLGVGYFKVNVDDEFLLQVEADNNTRWRVIDLESGTNYGLEAPIRLQGPVSVAVVNLGPEDLDPDEHCSAFCAFEGRSMSLWIEKPVDVEDSGQLGDSGGLEDTGLEPEDPRAGACACASSSKNSQLGGFGMSVLLGLFWRRRR